MSVAELLVAGEWLEAAYQLPFALFQGVLAYSFIYFAWRWLQLSIENDERRRRRDQWLDEQIAGDTKERPAG